MTTKAVLYCKCRNWGNTLSNYIKLYHNFISTTSYNDYNVFPKLRHTYGLTPPSTWIVRRRSHADRRVGNVHNHVDQTSIVPGGDISVTSG